MCLNLAAEDLFRLVGSGESAMPFEKPGETCFFREQGINLWEADEQYDRKGGFRRKVFSQVGVEKPSAA